MHACTHACRQTDRQTMLVCVCVFFFGGRGELGECAFFWSAFVSELGLQGVGFRAGSAKVGLERPLEEEGGFGA